MKRTAYRSRDAFAQVTWDMVEECGGDIVLAVVFDWIAWKADSKYDGYEDRDGNVWYPTSVSALSGTMRTSEKTIRRALSALVDQGHLVSTQLRLGGYGDRTMSYRPVWVDEVSDEVSAVPDAENRRDSAFAHTGESIRPDGQISFAQTGESTITNHLLTGHKELTLIGDEDLSAGPSIEELFSDFWTAWPRKVERKAAVRAYTSALSGTGHRTSDTAAMILAAATAWAAQWRDVEQRPVDKIPHAATWLNGERWNDEIPAPTPPSSDGRVSAAARGALLTRELMEGQQHGQLGSLRPLDAGGHR